MELFFDVFLESLHGERSGIRFMGQCFGIRSTINGSGIRSMENQSGIRSIGREAPRFAPLRKTPGFVPSPSGGGECLQIQTKMSFCAVAYRCVRDGA